MSRVAFAGAPENAIYAYSNGLFRSRDGGQTWVALHLLPAGVRHPNVNEILVHPTNPRIVYVFTEGPPARVWKTTDGGDHWSDVSNGLPANEDLLDDAAIITRTPDTLYVLASKDVYVTRNGGDQWTRLTTITEGASPFGPAVVGFAAAPSTPGRLYAWSGSNMIRSDDDGATWRSLNLVRGNGQTVILNAAVHPRNADEIVLSANFFQGVALSSANTQVSTDGGNTFSERSTKATTARFEIDPSGTYHYLGCCGDYCRSENQANSWTCTSLGQGPRDWTFDPATPGLTYFGENNGVSRSTDRGATRTLLTGTARPTLERPASELRLALAQGTVGSFTLPLRSVEQNDWRIPFTISGVPSWLTLSVLSGTTPASVSATIDTANLPLGVTTAELTLSSAQAASETKLPFSVVVTPAVGAPPYTSALIGGGGSSNAIGFSGAATQVSLSPSRIAVDPAGNVLVATSLPYAIHRIDRQSRFTHIAGTGTSGNTGDEGPAVSAQIGTINGLFADASNVYLFQASPRVIRKVSGTTISTAITNNQLLTATSTGSNRLRAGRDSTLIWADGSHVYQYSPASQRAERIVLGQTGEGPYTDIAVAPGGGYYVVDSVRNQVFLVRSNAARRLIAGSGTRGFAGDGGPATEALLAAPSAIAVGGDGTLFIADSGNNRVRAVTTDGVIRTYAGDGRSTGTRTGELATQMPLDRVIDIALAANGELIVADASRVYRLTRAQVVPAISSGGLVHQSTYKPVETPCRYFSIFGNNLATGTQTVNTATWSTRMGGVEVRIQGRLAPLYYVSPTQINGQTPYETTPGDATATVTTEGVTTNVVSAEVRRAAPGVLVVTNSDGTYNKLQGGAAVGDYVVAYATGVGPVDGQQSTGDPAAADPLPRSTSNY
ncbi:MAG TPA: hypothetical protein VER03_16425, partial [Bryobacteraceae bacterium]|nr:hypothetical protein [Bryobacteraceae bacterium]